MTYGKSSAPYLASRCLRHLAEQNYNSYPQNYNSYPLYLKLRKWCLNGARFLASILTEDQEISLDIADTANRTTKTPKTDELCRKASTLYTQPITKRVVAAEISRNFTAFAKLSNEKLKFLILKVMNLKTLIWHGASKFKSS